MYTSIYVVMDVHIQYIYLPRESIDLGCTIPSPLTQVEGELLRSSEISVNEQNTDLTLYIQ